MFVLSIVLRLESTVDVEAGFEVIGKHKHYLFFPPRSIAEERSLLALKDS